MDEQLKTSVGEIANLIGESWKALAICAGIRSKIYEELNPETPVTVEELARKKNYDQSKIEKWIYFMLSLGIVRKEGEKYFLTPKGNILSNNSPFKDLLGMFQLTEFFIESVLNSAETFKQHSSQDKLSEGKMSATYQPKVSDNISLVLLDVFKEYEMKANDSLLDFGCGNGSFLRALYKKMPDIIYTGVDTNLFAIERGKNELANLGISDKIRLVVLDVTEEMDELGEQSFDWITGINLFHFIPEHLRSKVIDNMVRVCRKGIFFTQGIIEASPISAGANALTPLLWNDFSGVYKKADADALNKALKTLYRNFSLKVIPIMQGTSNLVIMIRN
jgi:ubiquinone/menaquinone biosynthesis C-methylase UbiE